LKDERRDQNLHGWSKEVGFRGLAKIILAGFLFGFVFATLGYGHWTELFLWNTFGIALLPFGVWFIIPACIIGTVILFKH
jgi:hypothetical protein